MGRERRTGWKEEKKIGGDGNVLYLYQGSGYNWYTHLSKPNSLYNEDLIILLYATFIIKKEIKIKFNILQNIIHI